MEDDDLSPWTDSTLFTYDRPRNGSPADAMADNGAAAAPSGVWNE